MRGEAFKGQAGEDLASKELAEILATLAMIEREACHVNRAQHGGELIVGEERLVNPLRLARYANSRRL